MLMADGSTMSAMSRPLPSSFSIFILSNITLVAFGSRSSMLARTRPSAASRLALWARDARELRSRPSRCAASARPTP
uniref:Uncharacterized protein n=1 Tax=Arundo donax TaxID=35708 RepID=A0A0A9HNI7_ARUDO